MTRIFRSGIEIGNLSDFTATTTVGAGTCAASGDYPHHGNWGMKATGRFGAVDEGWVYYTLPTTRASLFKRDVIYFANLPFPAGSVRSLTLSQFQAAAAGGIAALRLEYNGLVYRWMLTYYSNGANHDAYSPAVSIVTGKHYVIELGTTIHATLGEHHVYVDGIEVITVTGIKTDDKGNMQHIVSGIYDIIGNLTAPIAIYFDCIMAADFYIGTGSIWGLNPKFHNSHSGL